MGIKSFYWKKTPTGIVDTEGGLYLTEHDLAKIGFLYLNEEKWDSHQLITAEWVRTSIAEHANPNLRYDPERRYGVAWAHPLKGKGRCETWHPLTGAA